LAFGIFRCLARHPDEFAALTVDNLDFALTAFERAGKLVGVLA